MTTTARNFRAVDALTGEKAEGASRFFEALSEADNFVREIDRVHELETRVQELTVERDEALALVRQWRETALGAIPHVEGDL